MPVALDQRGAISMLRLEGDVDIGDAIEFKGLLVDALTRAKELHIQLGDASAIDVTIMQLLWAAEHQAIAAGVAFHIETPVPDDIVSAMTLAGLPQFSLDKR